MKNTKAYFFHGLESSLPSSKVDVMKSLGWEVGAHPMNYNGRQPYKTALSYVSEFQPDIIIGTSLGGLTARYMSTYLNLSAILLNPAFCFKNYQVDFPNDFGQFKPRFWALLGENDEVVNFSQNKLEMEKIGASIFVNTHGHRTPADIFSDFLQKNLLEIETSVIK